METSPTDRKVTNSVTAERRLMQEDKMLRRKVQRALQNYYWSMHTPADGRECAARMISILEDELRRVCKMYAMPTDTRPAPHHVEYRSDGSVVHSGYDPECVLGICRDRRAHLQRLTDDEALAKSMFGYTPQEIRQGGLS